MSYILQESTQQIVRKTRRPVKVVYSVTSGSPPLGFLLRREQSCRRAEALLPPSNHIRATHSQLCHSASLALKMTWGCFGIVRTVQDKVGKKPTDERPSELRRVYYISNFVAYCRNLSFMTVRDASIPFRMANTSIEAIVEVTEQERTLGELSRANLQAARSLFESNGFVAWQCLWVRDERDFDRDTLDVLRSLPTGGDFIYVNTRSLLPREVIYNKVRWLLSSDILFAIPLTSG